jgi:type III secretory pathway component EscT
VSPFAAAEPLVAGAVLHALRLLPAALLSPLLGGPLVPAHVRLALALGLGACAHAAAGASPVPGGVAYAGAAVRELALGAALGFVATVPFEAARAGGRLADTLRGATLTELHVAPVRQRETALGDLLAQWTVVLAASAGGVALVAEALLATFAALPAGAPIPPALALAPVLRGAAELLACALAVGAPAAAGVLAADLAVALAARAAPHLALPSLAQPARAALGLAALAVAAAGLAGRLTAGVASAVRLLAVPGAP